MNKKRIIISILLGAFLGLFCVIGVGSRVGYSGNGLFLFAMWYNRFVMGFMFGLISDFKILDNSWNVVLRGAIVGTLISSAFYLSTEFRDLPALFAGALYGIIIDSVATRMSRR